MSDKRAKFEGTISAPVGGGGWRLGAGGCGFPLNPHQEASGGRV
jgi:hypothetical protein